MRFNGRHRYVQPAVVIAHDGGLYFQHPVQRSVRRKTESLQLTEIPGNELFPPVHVILPEHMQQRFVQAVHGAPFGGHVQHALHRTAHHRPQPAGLAEVAAGDLRAVGLVHMLRRGPYEERFTDLVADEVPQLSSEF